MTILETGKNLYFRGAFNCLYKYLYYRVRLYNYKDFVPTFMKGRRRENWTRKDYYTVLTTKVNGPQVFEEEFWSNNYKGERSPFKFPERI